MKLSCCLLLLVAVATSWAAPRQGKEYQRWWEDDWDGLDEWWKPEPSEKVEKDDSNVVPGSYSKTIYDEQYLKSHPGAKKAKEDAEEEKKSLKEVQDKKAKKEPHADLKKVEGKAVFDKKDKPNSKRGKPKKVDFPKAKATKKVVDEQKRRKKKKDKASGEKKGLEAFTLKANSVRPKAVVPKKEPPHPTSPPPTVDKYDTYDKYDDSYEDDSDDDDDDDDDVDSYSDEDYSDESYEDDYDYDESDEDDSDEDDDEYSSEENKDESKDESKDDSDEDSDEDSKDASKDSSQEKESDESSSKSSSQESAEAKRKKKFGSYGLNPVKEEPKYWGQTSADKSLRPQLVGSGFDQVAIERKKKKMAAERAEGKKVGKGEVKEDGKKWEKPQGGQKEFSSYRSDPQTSPNPAPPGLGSEGKVPPATTPGQDAVAMEMKTEEPKVISYMESRPLEFCQEDADCRMGRMCRTGVCVCQDVKACVGHNKPVCGSDGAWYPSHCELHRTACLKAQHIRIDHSQACLGDLGVKDGQKDMEAKAAAAESKHAKEASKLQDMKDKEGKLSANQAKYVPDKTVDPVSPKKKPAAASKDGFIDAEKIFDYSQVLKKDGIPEYAKKGKADNRFDEKYDEKAEGKRGKGKGGPPYNMMMGDAPAPDSEEEEEKEKKEEEECTKEEYEEFKEKLLLYHCQRFAEPDCKNEIHKERQYLATLMFSYYDRDLDYYLETKELEEIEEREHFTELSKHCRLGHVVRYSDREPLDGKLSVSEFLNAFDSVVTDSKAEEEDDRTQTTPPVVTLQRELKVIPTLATVGNGLELKCGILGAGDIVWQRYGADIRNLGAKDMTVFEDGSLFFSKVGLHHIGNYTCMDRSVPSVQQVHALSVQMPPKVRVSPSTQMQPRSDITIKCHAEGVPKPRLSWFENEMPLPARPEHFLLTHENSTLMVHNADFMRDTGAYKCVARNQAGEGAAVSSVLIIHPNDTATESTHKVYGTFVVFSEKGYMAYEPDNCLLVRDVRGDFGNFRFIPDTLDSRLSLCQADQPCRWGSVVNVRNQFLYISQPTLNRVVVVETGPKWNPIQVVATDRTPVSLQYVEHLDQVWVVCWNEKEDASMRTIVVIRDASKNIQHHAVHPQPVGNRFDLIMDLFVPPSNDLGHEFEYGFVTHADQRGFFKVDLLDMNYLKAVDLTSDDCVPKHMAFIPLGGYMVVQCERNREGRSLQLVMDYLTNTIISRTSAAGRPIVSPDSRHLVTVDRVSGRVSVTVISDKGKMEEAFEVTVSNAVSDVAFASAFAGKGYDLVLTAADSSDIIFVSLTNGKVEKIKGSHQAREGLLSSSFPSERPIISSGMFGDFLASPLRESISIVDGTHHSFKCEFAAPSRTQAIVFVEN